MGRTTALAWSRTIRELLEAIRDINHPMESGGINRALNYEYAVAALAILDGCVVEQTGSYADPPNPTRLRLVPDSGVVLDPQHNDAP